MSELVDAIEYYSEVDIDQFASMPLPFLQQLKGLTVFDIKGADQTRTRVVTTLIHGNEPSGFIACHQWLKSKKKPATNVRIIICNPEAAQTRPIFSNRYLAHSEDLNRFFDDSQSEESYRQHQGVIERAKQIKQCINAVQPEAILDLHNTSGKSAAFGVSVHESEKVLDLVSFFSAKLIYTGLRVGAVMEQDFNAPIVTIECGGANESESHEVAVQGLEQYFSKPDIFDHHAGRVTIYAHPIRVELQQDASVGFSHHCLPTTHITFRADIEELNHQQTTKGEFLGWCNSNKIPLSAIDENGVDRIDELLELRGNSLFAKCDMQLFMVTTVLEIATNDCLFYATKS